MDHNFSVPMKTYVYYRNIVLSCKTNTKKFTQYLADLQTMTASDKSYLEYSPKRILDDELSIVKFITNLSDINGVVSSFTCICVSNSIISYFLIYEVNNIDDREEILAMGSDFDILVGPRKLLSSKTCNLIIYSLSKCIYNLFYKSFIINYHYETKSECCNSLIDHYNMLEASQHFYIGINRIHNLSYNNDVLSWTINDDICKNILYFYNVLDKYVIKKIVSNKENEMKEIIYLDGDTIALNNISGYRPMRCLRNSNFALIRIPTTYQSVNIDICINIELNQINANAFDKEGNKVLQNLNLKYVVAINAAYNFVAKEDMKILELESFYKDKKFESVKKIGFHVLCVTLRYLFERYLFNCLAIRNASDIKIYTKMFGVNFLNDEFIGNNIVYGEESIKNFLKICHTSGIEIKEVLKNCSNV